MASIFCTRLLPEFCQKPWTLSLRSYRNQEWSDEHRPRFSSIRNPPVTRRAANLDLLRIDLNAARQPSCRPNRRSAFRCKLLGTDYDLGEPLILATLIR